MNYSSRRDIDHTGYLGNARLILNHFDVSTQADIHHTALSYESEDEIMARLHNKNRRDTAHYSKQDIREQYCISERGLGALESDRASLFGCLASHHASSPCSNKTSLLTACVRQKVPSDENLYELYRRRPADYAPYPRRNRYPWDPPGPEIYRYDKDLNSSYFRRKIPTDPNRYTWMPSDDESVRMEKPKSILEPSFSSSRSTSPGPPVKKHVSFARSHTLTSFDDAIVSLNSSSSHINKITRSQERLLDVRKTEVQPITKQPEPSDNVLLIDKFKRLSMKTQATQTEACLGRKPVPPGNPNLSPRSMNRMVSQGAQTNGIMINGRKLMKSYSEAGNRFIGASSGPDYYNFEAIQDHEPLQRTQSDEPPRSPFVLNESPPPPVVATQEPTNFHAVPSETSSVSKSDHESEESEAKKEIFIDFKPQVPNSEVKTKRPLTKTVSDGEILLDKEMDLSPKQQTSMSHECLLQQQDENESNFVPYFQTSPIRHEGIFKQLEDPIFSSLSESFDEGGAFLRPQDSIDEEFHENLIYNKMYVKHQDSLNISMEEFAKRKRQGSPNDECVVPQVFLRSDKSPFNSNDSLSNDIRDHSDDIWNESQATVLHMDSGTENGAAISSSEVASPGTSINLLTPSSKRRQLLLLQHQQRSSIDTEVLDEEIEIEPSVRPAKKTVTVIDQSTKQQYLTPKRISIANHRKRHPLPIEPSMPAVVPDLLHRTDSCKTTNTDVSESTTTDDYITANSGTDSSRKSGSTKGDIYSTVHTQVYDGSSYESIKGDLLEEMVVPSFSSPILSEGRNLSTPVPEVRTGRSTPSETSSSCGSYSVDGSCPDLLDRASRVPSIIKPDYGEDEYYESPPDDNYSTNYSNYDGEVLNRRPYHLEVARQEKFKTIKRDKTSPSKEQQKSADKKRSKARAKSPMKNHQKKNSQQTKKSYYIRNDQLNDERFRKVLEEGKGTSDDSSCDFAISKFLASQNSPRKMKKNKENNRRKSLPRSPTGQKSRKSSEEKSTSLPGSLQRRKSSKCKNATHDEPQKNTLSPTGSPSCKRHSPQKSPDTAKLKALSAESLRSVSPGSDSVFYSDPSSQTADHQVHCLHCGKEVDIITTDEKTTESHDIVQPPAGFEDSPKQRHHHQVKLFKKLERRIRSEERSVAEKRHKYKPDVRAKSEERDANVYKNKLRPMARSTTNSQEGLKSTDSSPSILPGDPEEEDDVGVYDVPYSIGQWVYVDERDEVTSKVNSPTDVRRSSISSTESEQDFKKRYQAATHRMVHRKSCLEMYKRQTSRSFESDKTVIVQRESGEFGFRIHGSKPVVVSAIEPGTPAETSGLEVGDIVVSVNGVSVMDRSHSEVVKIAHAGSDTLTLEVARTCYAVNTTQDLHSTPSLFSGYLWKLSGFASGVSTNKWIRRWFVLKENNCLYYYKTDTEKQPVGAVMLMDHEVQKLEEEKNGASKSYRFTIKRADGVPLYLAADNQSSQNRWVEVVEKAINDSKIVDEYLEETKRNLTLAPSHISNPDCFGYLVKLGTQWKSWSRRYCVLKDACLYFYSDANAKNAFGVAYLHGYRVQQSLSGSKKHAFEIIPADPEHKHYYFHTESDTDRKRWIAALEYSIDRWLKIN